MDKNILISQLQNDNITYNNITKMSIVQGDDYTTGCLWDYNNLYNYYKMIAIDLSKQQAFDADPKSIQQISFTRNLNQVQNRNDNTAIFFFIEKWKKPF